MPVCAYTALTHQNDTVLSRTVLGLLPQPDIAEGAGHAVQVRPRGHALAVQLQPQLLHRLRGLCVFRKEWVDEFLVLFPF